MMVLMFSKIIIITLINIILLTLIWYCMELLILVWKYMYNPTAKLPHNKFILSVLILSNTQHWHVCVLTTTPHNQHRSCWHHLRPVPSTEWPQNAGSPAFSTCKGRPPSPLPFIFPATLRQWNRLPRSLSSTTCPEAFRTGVRALTSALISS